SGPAFPVSADVAGMEGLSGSAMGMSLRQYAAIHLRVPDSGVDWMDEMIRKAQRDELAAKAMHAIITEPTYEGAQSFLMYFKKRLGLKGEGMDAYAQVAYAMADAMLKEREE